MVSQNEIKYVLRYSIYFGLCSLENGLAVRNILSIVPCSLAREGTTWSKGTTVNYLK